MFCNNCGTQIPDDVNFCPSCGQAVEVETDGQQATQPVNQAQPTTQPVNQTQPVYQASAGGQQSYGAGNKKLMYIIIAIAGAFLIAVIVFGILILGKLGNNDSGDKDSVKTEASVDKDEKSDSDDDSDDNLDDADEDSDDTEEVSAENADSSDAGLSDKAAIIAERFPNLLETYTAPKSEKTFWINIDDATREKLNALDNDYHKVAWVVEYAFRQLPSVVVSFTVNENCGVPYIFLAFTNVGDVPVSIDGAADVYDFDNVKLTSGYPYTGMLQPGGTYICPIACPGVDENNVDIGYTELNMDFPSAKYGTYTSSASVGASSGSNITASVSLENTSENKLNMGQVTVLLLDEMGFPVANGYVFSATSTNSGEKMETDLQMGILDSDVELVSDTAVFASPYVTG